ncbi:hypothetical protein [Streptomyces sp. NPDC060366]|uniref:hypothetical protein n=1 Tax=Streptomyces sp. NPDC060366 TaxID=3347105 RepID=UPI0036494FA2
MTDTNGIDAAASLGAFFAERTAQARAEAAKANAARAEAEQAAAAFAERQELPPAVGAMKQGWEMAGWFTERSSRIGSDAISGKASREQYDQAKAEREAVLDWLDANGYEVPGPYR